MQNIHVVTEISQKCVFSIPTLRRMPENQGIQSGPIPETLDFTGFFDNICTENGLFSFKYVHTGHTDYSITLFV